MLSAENSLLGVPPPAKAFDVILQNKPVESSTKRACPMGHITVRSLSVRNDLMKLFQVEHCRDRL